MAKLVRILLLLFSVFCCLFGISSGENDSNRPVVTYDGRSLIINGSRHLLFSGSIHYTRSTPEMWPDIIKKAKEGGLNVIQTYVFWNIHEPIRGQYNFEGNYDLVKFIKLIGEHGLWATLRVGPYIEAEWNMGGFPYWLREIPGITFRSYNEPFMFHMKKYVSMIIKLMKEHNLFIEQGGPIILAQIENEYNNVQVTYKQKGSQYVKWAAEMAVGLYDRVPWVMCKQKDAPQSIISTCNGRQCGDTFTGPNGPNKPYLWTENWTAQYRVFGDAPSQRSAEDLAFAVTRFFSRNGTLNNYYMKFVADPAQVGSGSSVYAARWLTHKVNEDYSHKRFNTKSIDCSTTITHSISVSKYHGGTNFGRTSSCFVTTRYYDEAPLDEYGLKREPKFGHLRDLHRALRLSKKPLLWGTPLVQRINQDLEITTYEKPGSNICAAFLTNNNTKDPATITFRGVDYYLPPKSISILPDCKTVVYNTDTVVAQHSARNFVVSKKAKITKWRMHRENVPTREELRLESKAPLELYTLTKDTSDCAWYSTSIEINRQDLPKRPDIVPILQVASLGHALLAFVNGEYIGFGHGSNVEKSHVLRKPVNLKPGINNISLLAMTVGFPNNGAYMERRFAGPRAVVLQGLMSGTLDITSNNWGHKVGVTGEKLQLYTKHGSKGVEWFPLDGNSGPVTWYKSHFNSPEGDGPVAIRMSSMQKGMVWVNGKSIGRYWASYLSPLGIPTQQEYHIPRSFLRPRNNLLMVFEETGGNPENIEILTVNRDTICSVITEHHPPHVKTWERKHSQFRAIADPVNAAHLTCPENKVISKVEFVSFGDHEGACGSFQPGTCDSSNAKQVVEKKCLGQNKCSVTIDREEILDGVEDSCPHTAKTLAIQVACDTQNDDFA